MDDILDVYLNKINLFFPASRQEHHALNDRIADSVFNQIGKLFLQKFNQITQALMYRTLYKQVLIAA